MSALFVAALLMTASAPLRTAAAQAATVPDTIEQRLAACAICHGEKGEGLQKNEYYPRLAGKPAGYLYHQLINFRDKRREFAIMNYMVAFLSDQYLLEIADHYAKLATPFPAPSARVGAGELALGRKLVNEGDPARKLPACTACHGKTLSGLEPAIPGLVGLHPPYISAQMGAWKNNARHAMKPDCMREVAALLTPGDIAAITAWLAAQPIPDDVRPAPAGSLALPLACGGMTGK